MSRNAKIVIGLVCLCLALCAGTTILAVSAVGLAGVTAGRTIDTDPAHVNAAAAQIADFDLPAGWKPDHTTEIAGWLLAAYTPGDGHSHIYLVQGPSNVVLDQPALDLAAQLLGTPRADSSARSQVVGSINATIRGQKTVLITSRDWNHDNQPFQTVTTVFQGKGGPAFVSVSSPLGVWDQADVERFIASIH